MTALIFETLKKINDDLNGELATELIDLKLLFLIKALDGDNRKYSGIKNGFEAIFNHRHFDQNPILKKMTAKFLTIIINLMSEEIQFNNYLVKENTVYSQEGLKYFDKKYIVSELLEVPLKYN